MCKIGDIIKIEKYICDDGALVGRHTFVVLSEDKDTIKGLSFDLVATPMSSIKSEKHREKIAKNHRLMIIKTNDQNNMPASKYEESFIKAHLMYYFKKDKIKYQVLGALNVETFLELENKLSLLDSKNEIEQIIKNIEEYINE